MNEKSQTITNADENDAALWAKMREEAQAAAAAEPALKGYFEAVILNHATYASALSAQLARKLEDANIGAEQWAEIFSSVYAKSPELEDIALADAAVAFDRDPACHRYMKPMLYFKGYLVLQIQRIENWLWRHNKKDLALYLQSRVSELFAVDIHPATKIGRRVFIDHATGIVIGETAVIDDDVSILQNVTLGGTGKDEGDRHPKIRRGALISVGAKVLGNIEVGEDAKVAAGSVVLKNVKPHSTVAGVPAKEVGQSAGKPSETMDQTFNYEIYSI